MYPTQPHHECIVGFWSRTFFPWPVFRVVMDLFSFPYGHTIAQIHADWRESFPFIHAYRRNSLPLHSRLLKRHFSLIHAYWRHTPPFIEGYWRAHSPLIVGFSRATHPPHSRIFGAHFPFFVRYCGSLSLFMVIGGTYPFIEGYCTGTLPPHPLHSASSLTHTNTLKHQFPSRTWTLMACVYTQGSARVRDPEKWLFYIQAVDISEVLNTNSDLITHVQITGNRFPHKHELPSRTWTIRACVYTHRAAHGFETQRSDFFLSSCGQFRGAEHEFRPDNTCTKHRKHDSSTGNTIPH